jgi:DNA-3-methyladenine glycosylase
VYPRRLLAEDSIAAACGLLGARLVRSDGWGARVGRIVEIEAYIGTDDRASHARFGPTRRNGVMFGPPGHAYVYLVYGMHHCLNVVTEPRGFAAALLVRSIEPLEGGDLMRRAREEWVVARAARRGSALGSSARAAAARQRVAALPLARLASGPGLVCAAFSIGLGEDGADLCNPAASLHLEPARPGDPALEPAFGPRVGLGATPEPWLSKPWRVWAAGNPAVSGPRTRR